MMLWFDAIEIPILIYAIIFTCYYFKKQKMIKLNNNEILVVISSYELEDFIVENIKRIKKEFKQVVVLTVKDNGVKIDGVDIIKTPKDFKCMSIRKGRDLLYFARNYKVPSEVKYILFLDEDSYPEIPIEIPDRDVVLLFETPHNCKRKDIMITEMQRLGFSLEEKLFLDLRLVFYLWGGGLLIKKEYLKYIPDYPTIIEDTVYGWMLLKTDATFGKSFTRVHSLPPSDLKSMYKQRARWLMGTIFDLNLAPWYLRILTSIRIFYWLFSLIIFIFCDWWVKLLIFIVFFIQSLIVCRLCNYPKYYALFWIVGAILNTSMAWTSPFIQRKRTFNVTKKCVPKSR